MADTVAQDAVVRTGRGLTIAGTRITLYDVMDYLKADWPPSLIQQWLSLTDAQIADAMEYISTHRDEVEAEYQLVLQQAEEVRAYWEDRNRLLLDRIRDLPAKPGQEELIAKLRARKEQLRLR
ncbi:MAG TPA: DUF433 domain-containing protein [Blastocatellia bacterium]|nr:DUF433 domain-containing protein [Blastocatellia bacterium]